MELQELIARGRFVFASVPERIKVFVLVDGRTSAKVIAQRTSRPLTSILNDLKKLRDVELVDVKKDKVGKPVKSHGSLVYEKAPLARQIPLSFFRGSTKAAKVMATAPAGRSAARRPTIRPLGIPSQTEVLDICRRGEDQVFEFKGPGVETQKITREIAAFLHTPQGGIIFYGVRDDGTIAGTDTPRQKLDQQLHNSVRNTIAPAPSIQVRSISVLGAEVVLIIIPPWNRRNVYFYQGRVYVRKGTNVFEAKPEEVKRLHEGKPIM